MADHAHDNHGHAHGGHDDHGHDDHGHGHGHDEHWGDYNAEPLPPSNLPPIGLGALLTFGVALTAMLAAITMYSVVLPEKGDGHGHGAAHAEGGHHH